MLSNSNLRSNLNSSRTTSLDSNLYTGMSNSNWSNAIAKPNSGAPSAGTDFLRKRMQKLSQCSSYILEGKGLRDDMSFLKLRARLEKLGLTLQ